MIDKFIEHPEIFFDPLVSLIYFGVGLAFIWYYDALLEKKIKKGITSIVLLLSFIWGVSGFFVILEFFDFLVGITKKLIELNISNFIPSNIYQLLYMSISDWDIYLNSLTNSKHDFLEHRSLLFSSIIIPLVLLTISFITSKLFIKRFTWLVKILYNFSLGLFLGISINLAIDILIHLINKLLITLFSLLSLNIPNLVSTDININNLPHLTSWLWLIINICLGLLIPTIIIWKNSFIHNYNENERG